MKNKALITLLTGFFPLFLYNCQSEVKEEITNNALNELYIYDVDNNANMQITISPDVTESRYTFTSDSRKVMFFTTAGGYTLDLFSPGTTRWTGFLPVTVDYSPDRTQIVYSQNKDLFIMNTDGTNTRQLTTDGLSYFHPKWSNDGQKIVCDYQNGICVVSINGAVQNISNEKSGEKFEWSLDSNTIFYPKRDAQSWVQIFGYHLSGNLEEQLTNTSKYSYNPSVNPVNGKVAYTSGGDLMVMDPDGTHQIQIYHDTSASTPYWSPDGTRIAFISGQLGLNSELAVIDANGDNFKVISSFKGGYQEPVWSPDGKLILYRRLISYL